MYSTSKKKFFAIYLKNKQETCKGFELFHIDHKWVWSAWLTPLVILDPYGFIQNLNLPCLKQISDRGLLFLKRYGWLMNDDIPRTKNGKIVELAVKNTIEGNKIKNKEALANPRVLDQYKNLKELNY